MQSGSVPPLKFARPICTCVVWGGQQTPPIAIHPPNPPHDDELTGVLVVVVATGAVVVVVATGAVVEVAVAVTGGAVVTGMVTWT